MSMKRREFLKTTVGGTAALVGLRGKAWGQAKPVRIGYTLSATGPYAPGAQYSQATNYALWAEQVNAKGGLMVKGEGRRPIEFVSIDDRSEIETAVRSYEKLMTEDKVDLILPPWGTAMHFAVAPVANKYGYPMIGPTVGSAKLEGKAAGVDAFIGLSYPPDNILMTGQAKEVDYNPRVYFTAVGTAFFFYRD